MHGGQRPGAAEAQHAPWTKGCMVRFAGAGIPENGDVVDVATNEKGLTRG